jgi:short-subunit dehydrogenase
VKRTAIITGISGTLGSALGREYIRRGWHVVGVSRKNELSGNFLSELCTNPQQSADDAQALLKYDADLIILNAGQIETEISEQGVPLTEMTESITNVNYVFPAILSLEASKIERIRQLDIIAIGSIADGSPSSFGPVYHASKIAIHYFFSGVGPIVNSANQNIRMRLYRPGAIKGPLSWAPVNRLNEQGYKIRAKRCNSAPESHEVARTIARWIDGNEWVGTYKEPFSFKVFKWFFALAPNAFYKLQILGWRKGSKFV